MALFSPCSFQFLQFHKHYSAIPKPSISKTLIRITTVLKISSKSISASPNKPCPSLQTILCSSSSSLESDNSPSTGIFIKGLPQSTTEGHLKKTFLQFGEVSQVKIITEMNSKQSLGSAFVWFTRKESAQLAVEGMNGKFFDGRFILVTIAKPGLSEGRGRAKPYKF